MGEVEKEVGGYARRRWNAGHCGDVDASNKEGG